MTTKQMCVEIQELYSKAKDLRNSIGYAVEKYLNSTLSVGSCNDEYTIPGKVCKEEIGWSYNNNGTMTINYVVFTNIYGDISSEKDMIVDCSVIDNYYDGL